MSIFFTVSVILKIAVSKINYPCFVKKKRKKEYIYIYLVLLKKIFSVCVFHLNP